MSNLSNVGHGQRDQLNSKQPSRQTVPVVEYTNQSVNQTKHGTVTNQWWQNWRGERRLPTVKVPAGEEVGEAAGEVAIGLLEVKHEEGGEQQQQLE